MRAIFSPPSILQHEVAGETKEGLFEPSSLVCSPPAVRLICISSPYATRGWCYDQWRKHWGKASSTLVWKCPSRVMNPLLPQAEIDRAMAEDRLAACQR